MNERIYDASSCALGDAVYVYGSNNSTPSFFIEKLCNAGTSDVHAIEPWVSISLPNHIEYSMAQVIFLPVNSSEIAIIGTNVDDRLISCIFDTRACTYKNSQSNHETIRGIPADAQLMSNNKIIASFEERNILFENNSYAFDVVPKVFTLEQS